MHKLIAFCLLTLPAVCQDTYRVRGIVSGSDCIGCNDPDSYSECMLKDSAEALRSQSQKEEHDEGVGFVYHRFVVEVCSFPEKFSLSSPIREAQGVMVIGVIWPREAHPVNHFTREKIVKNALRMVRSHMDDIAALEVIEHDQAIYQVNLHLRQK